MKYIDNGNHIKVTDIDLYNDEECLELGRLAAHECIVFVDRPITERRLHEMQSQWGDTSRALMHKYIGERKVSGPHWRKLLTNLTYISKAVEDKQDGMTRVSFIKDEKGKPTGIFADGELDWHADQQTFLQPQRIISLASLFGSKNSQTSFLRTSEMYAKLNHEDKSMVDELVSVFEWDGGSMSYGTSEDQMEIVRYHMVPLNGIERPLKDQTATGREGLCWPSHSFSHFKGMDKEESKKYHEHLWSLLNKPEYIYTRDWQDGQLMIMDQNITVHARPTNIQEGNLRTMTRMISFVNNLFPGNEEYPWVMWNGQKIPQDDFVKMVDEQRIKEWKK
jgi:alpha-ketoglutarate-dependent taurine dioxygenase